jgi:hypothetical protein
MLCKPNVDLGYLLLAFFRYYGNPMNMNLETEISVCTATVNFKTTSLVVSVCKSFAIASKTLRSALIDATSTSAKMQSTVPHCMSCSLLALIINAKRLTEQRAAYSRRADDWAKFTANTNSQAVLASKRSNTSSGSSSNNNSRLNPFPRVVAADAVANDILTMLHSKAANGSIGGRSATGSSMSGSVAKAHVHKPLTLKQVQEINPMLALRLKTFSSVREVTIRLSSSGGGGSSSSGSNANSRAFGGSNSARRVVHGGRSRSPSPTNMSRSGRSGSGSYKTTRHGMVGAAIGASIANNRSSSKSSGDGSGRGGGNKRQRKY